MFSWTDRETERGEILTEDKRGQDTKAQPEMYICGDQMEAETRKDDSRISEPILKADLRLSLRLLSLVSLGLEPQPNPICLGAEQKQIVKKGEAKTIA